MLRKLVDRLFGSGPAAAGGSPPPHAIPVQEVAAPAPVRFAFKLFHQMSPGGPRANLFISPASIAFALTLAQRGAGGRTQSEMSEVLELQGMSGEDINNGAKVLKTVLKRSSDEVILNIANSLWVTKGFSFKPEFVELARMYFSAEARDLDFKLPESADTINAWVSEKTSGKIPGIVTHEQLRTSLFVLINAIYFKGIWSEDFEFKKERTQDGPFTLLGGKTKTCPMMRNYRTYRYMDTPDYQLVRIPYGDGSVAFYLLLPAKDRDFKSFITQFNAGRWEGSIAQMDDVPGSLVMPRFRIEFSAEIKSILESLGMKLAMSGAADFNAMSASQLKIGAVIHKTFVELNERGTEAAAVTAVLMVAGCAPSIPKRTFEMTVDRPFLCAIRDDRTQTLLFLGAIVEP